MFSRPDQGSDGQNNQQSNPESNSSGPVNAAPSVSLPKGGGAIRGIGEKFSANPVTGTASAGIPVAVSPGRAGVTPQISLSYDSGNGNGIFGYGWNAGLPSITRKTDKGLPCFEDDAEPEKDIFTISGSEDLVRVLKQDNGAWNPEILTREVEGVPYEIRTYRPRIEGLFARIERWTNGRTREIHWRSISRDNITTLYGKTPESRIADPSDPKRIFSWLICESYDDVGNVIAYRYKAEDGAGVDLTLPHEAGRTERERTANRYPKRILYGNRVSRLLEPDLACQEWHFELVFDYGEHADEFPTPAEERPWTVRDDPYSMYRATFEVRTYRLCRRILMFHHFPNEPEVGRDCLVHSTDLRYEGMRGDLPSIDESRRRGAFIVEATHRSYKRSGSGYLTAAMPSVEFAYGPANIDETVRELDRADWENMPYGTDGGKYQWVDLDGEGLSGALTEQGGSLYYKRNLGGGRFAPLALVSTFPSTTQIADGRQRLLSLDGDGKLDLVDFSGPSPGFFERTEDGGWEPYRPFVSLPQIPWNDPNVKLVDLDGDGLADILITEADVIVWYPSLADSGFGNPSMVYPAFDEDRGARLVFSDPEQSLFLADMSGDGLADLLRVRNGEVCYWPNLGYGRFGKKVQMDRSPWFDIADQFDPRRIRLADIDGSGTSDLIYLASDSIRLFFNESGNGWSAMRALTEVPQTGALENIQAVDLLGNGVACLVWSSSLPGDASRPIRYIDLMGSHKPHLLEEMRNNMGSETRIRYAASTQFYVADRAAGRPWLTRLPFPVQVVVRVETCDKISHSLMVTRYAYHDGYYDGIEREFRGFGFVEQWDAEEIGNSPSPQNHPSRRSASGIDRPPILTKTWHHTGAPFESGPSLRLFEQDYFDESDVTGIPARAALLRDVRLPDDYTWLEAREAARALKGALLRQEVYALDGSPQERLPYTISESSYTIERFQPLGENKYRVFFTHPHETLQAHYERTLYTVNGRTVLDPRITQDVTLEVDAYGNVLQSAILAYGRRYEADDAILTPSDHAEQKRSWITMTESRYTNAVLEPDAHRTPAPFEMHSYEIVDSRTDLLTFDDVKRLVRQTAQSGRTLPFEDLAAASDQPCRRLLGHTLTVYRRDDLDGALPAGRIEARALVYDNYKLALTPGLIARAYGGRVTDEILAEGGYVRLEGKSGWWIPSGRTFYAVEEMPAAQELAEAAAHFFTPCRYVNPFGDATIVRHDPYDLLIQETRDPMGNIVTAGERDAAGKRTSQGNDYRLLLPHLVSDANRNRSAVVFDTLGLVVGSAVMGKPEEQEGDTLEGFEPDLPPETVLAHLSYPLKDPYDILAGATMRLLYDLFAYQRTQDQEQPQPTVAYTLTRETHVSALAEGEQTKLQHLFEYSDGFGREIQKKLQAEPGKLPDESSPGPRWIGSGWTLYDNKANPVRQYEPFFSATHRFEFETVAGVSAIMLYDSAERVVATIQPNHTYEKTVFCPWSDITWDVNDTVLITDPERDPDIGGYAAGLPDDDYLPTWFAARIDGQMGEAEKQAARKTADHAATPTVAHKDPLARAWLLIDHNRTERDGLMVDERYPTRLTLDISGFMRSVHDAKNRIVQRTDYSLIGAILHQESFESGERWMLSDISGKPFYLWDNRGHRLHTTYDSNRRPSEIHVSTDGAAEVVVTRTVYGESLSDGEARNLRGKTYRTFDTVGVATKEECDFKGNILESARQLLADYRSDPDWNAEPLLEEERFITRTQFDALNRPTQMIAPHSDRGGAPVNVIQPTYNEATLLEGIDVWLEMHEQPSGFLERSTADFPVIRNIDYDARGRRSLVQYGNGSRSRYEYDPQTFRLVGLRSTRAASAGDGEANGNILQDLHYTFDPVGNIIRIRDDAQQTAFFRNQVVEPSAEYRYDAVYRLLEATGREHLGQGGGIASPIPSGPGEVPWARLPDPGQANALGRYLERYIYDEVGNILEMVHRGSDDAHPGWRRRYDYEEASALEPDQRSNRLTATQIGQGASQLYHYDAHGNMTSMSHLPLMQWDSRDQLQASARQVIGSGDSPEITYYQYDASGRRVRKVVDAAQRQGDTKPLRRYERIYLESFEIYREYAPSGEVITERETLHVMDDHRRAALIDTRTRGRDDSPERTIRLILEDHQGSARLELDQHSRIVSYEEFYPFGSTSYRAVRSRTEVSNRYRFTGKERDDETGLYYHGARYYAAWLGRWTAPDPQFRPNLSNSYAYVRNNPIVFTDPNGKEPSTWNRVTGGLRMVGGAIQATVGAAVFVQVEVPVAAQVVGGIAIAHGADDFQAGARQLWTGEETKNVTQTVVASSLEAAHVSKDTSEKVATGVDIGLSFVSPAPISGGPRAATEVVAVTVPKLAVVAHTGDIVVTADKIVVTTADVAKVANRADQVAKVTSAAKATQLMKTGGSGGGGSGKKSDDEDKSSKSENKGEQNPKEAPKEASQVKTIVKHNAGNMQVEVNGQKWHLPSGTNAGKIPKVDQVGNALQEATTKAASTWSRKLLTANERAAIADAKASKEFWRANLLEKQAKGRYIEGQVRKQFPNLQWHRAGVDATDKATGISYEILSGTKSNMDAHAKRMADVLYRMITF